MDTKVKISTKYTRDEVFNATLKYFNGDELATNVWINKYALKDSLGNLFELTPDDMHHRLAKELARIEKKYKNGKSEEDIYEILKDFRYIIPQGGPMSGIGNDKQIISLSNCFVIGYEYDSYGSIMKTDEQQVQLMKRRGGVGHDLSHIRPAGFPVKNSALTSTGLVSFMDRYSNSTREVGQDGRRGALMLSCDVRHPNSEDFMNAKMEEGKVNGANISLKLNDDFMKSVIDNDTFEQMYPIGAKNPTTSIKTEAKPFFDKIVHNAWKSAEPGILFWDTVINESVSDCYADQGFKTVSTNPCLVGDTIIKTTKGDLEIKEIVERFEKGENFYVYTYNETTKEIEEKEVYNAILSKKNANIIEIVLDNDKTISLTPDHKVLSKERGWIEASQLTTNDTLIEIED